MKIDLNNLSLEELEIVLSIAKKQGTNNKESKNTGVSRTKVKFNSKKKQRHYKKWTQAEEDELYKLFVEGKTAKQIARKLKRTRNAVFGKTQKNGYKRYNREKK